MLSDKAKELFAKLDLEYEPIAIKFSYNCPAGFEELTESRQFCSYLKVAQTSDKPFFIRMSTDACLGKCVLGYEPFEDKCQAGIVGFERSLFGSQAANARLYHHITILKSGVANYVTFSKVSQCTFNPDLIIFVAPVEKAALIMRASSWVSGDPWESKSSVALSCAWTYAYPFVSGKVNTCMTGMHFGLTKQKLYPAGLHMITVPYQKIDEVVRGLDEMDWVYVAMREDEEGKEIAKAVDAKLKAYDDPEAVFDFSERCTHA